MAAPDLHRALRAGALYFTVVFAAGFGFGALRVSAIAPRFGETTAVLTEVPLMLAIAWAACGFALRRIGVARRTGPRLLMGGVALGLLLVAELALATAIGPGAGAWLAGRVAVPGLIGGAAQLLFAFIPALRR